MSYNQSRIHLNVHFIIIALVVSAEWSVLPVGAVAVAKFPHKMVGSKLEGLRQDTKVWSQGLVGQKLAAIPCCPVMSV